MHLDTPGVGCFYCDYTPLVFKVPCGGPAILACGFRSYFSWEIFAEFPKWLVEDEGRSVHLTITPAEIVATLCMSLTCISYLLALLTPVEAVDWWCAVM